MKKIDANPQGFLSELGKLLAEEKEKKAKENLDEKTKLEQKFGIETVAPTTLGEFFSQIAQVKEEIVESQKEEKNKFLKKYKIESIVPEELFGRLLQAKEDLEQELKEEIEKVEAQPIVETVVEEPTTVIAEVSEEQPKQKTIVDQVVAKITQQQENTNLFTDPQPEKTSPTIKALQDKLKSLEQWMGKISMAGPGSGSYWLNDLGDTDKTSLKNATEGQVLTFNESTKKWYAADATGGGGGPTLDTYARVTANAAFNQANTSLSTGFYANTAWDVANSAYGKANSANVIAQSSYDFANTVNTYSYSAYAQANAAVNQASNAILRAIDANTLATTANTKAQAAFNQANTALSTGFYANLAWSHANAAFDYANTISGGSGVDTWARDKANTASVTAQSGFDKANTASVTAQSGFDKANTASVTAQSGFDKANSANVLAQAAFDQANTAPTVIDTDIVAYANHVLKNKRTKWEYPKIRDYRGSNPSAFGNGQCYIKFNLYDEIHTILNHAYNNSLPIKLELHAKSNATLTPYTVITSFLQVNPDEITGANWSYNGSQSSYGDTYYELYAASVESFDNLPELGGYHIEWVFLTVDTLTVNAITTITSTTANNNGFRFDADAKTLTFPDDTVQTTAFTGTDLSGQLQIAFDTANSATSISTSAYAFANTVNIKTDAAFTKANAANVLAQNAYNFANTVNTYSYSSYSQANTATTTGQAAFNKANTSGVTAQSGFDKANTVSVTAQSGFDKANLAYSTALNVNSTLGVVIIDAQESYDKTNAAFDKANTAITTSGGSITGSLNVSYTPASTTGTALTITAANTIGGIGYADVFKITNTSGGATNGSKTFRVNNIGTLELINSAYTATLMGVSDSGQMSFAGASSTNNDPTTNFLSFNNNGLAIYDDGNPHIHARSSGASLWLNTNNGAIILGNQGVVNGGSPASAILMGSSTTIKAYCSIYGSKSYAISGYGYLATSGAGTIGGSSGTVPYSLYCDNRIQASEIDATSDERAKNIQGKIPLEQAMKFVREVDGIHYTWNKDAVEHNDTGLKAGFGAQAVHKAGFDHMIGVIPNDKMKEKVDEDGWVHPEGMQLTMGYNQAIPYHHEVIKNLLDRIEKLESELAELKKK